MKDVDAVGAVNPNPEETTMAAETAGKRKAGPWRIRHTRGGRGENFNIIRSADYSYVVEGVKGRPTEADACLIAAAPEMLQALTHLLAIYQDEDVPEVAEARALLASLSPQP
jgi:hypothetical protein